MHALTSTEVLDARVYRTAFLPALVALFVAAFALEDRPDPARSALPTDVFSAERAFGSGERPSRSRCTGMAAAFPDRTAGSRGRRRARATSSQQVFEAPEERGERAAFTVRRDVVPRPRPRPHQRRRDARRASRAPDRRARPPRRPGPGEPLRHRGAARARARAQVARAATRRSCSSPPRAPTHGLRGRAGVGAVARPAGPVDGVIVLGDMAGTQLKQAVGRRLAAAAAVAAARARAHGPGRGAARDPQRRRAARARSAQWVAARAADHGLRAGPDRRAKACRRCCSRSPASSARPPTSRSLENRLEAFGRAALGAIGAIDARRAARRRGVRGRAERHRDAAQRPARLGRAARRRLAAAARAARRARRVLPRPPPARPDRAVAGVAGGRRRAAAGRAGCGCARSARPA